MVLLRRVINLEKTQNPYILACHRTARKKMLKMQNSDKKGKYRIRDILYKQGRALVFEGTEILMARGRRWWGGRKWIRVAYFPVKNFRHVV